MNEKNDAMTEQTTDQLPDRLSSDPKSPYYNEAVLARDVGIRFKGVEKTNVEEYCVSEGWVRVTAGNAKDRYGNPLTIKVHGPVEPYFRDKARPETDRNAAIAVMPGLAPGIHVFLAATLSRRGCPGQARA